MNRKLVFLNLALLALAGVLAWTLRANWFSAQSQQRAVIQQWKVDVPWARAGETTVANGGDVAKEAGLLPQDATQPQRSPLLATKPT